MTLLADEPPPAAFNAFTPPRRRTPFAFHRFRRLRWWPGAQEVGHILVHLGIARRIPVALGAALERARQRLLADRASSSPQQPPKPPRLPETSSLPVVHSCPRAGGMPRARRLTEPEYPKRSAVPPASDSRGRRHGARAASLHPRAGLAPGIGPLRPATPRASAARGTAGSRALERYRHPPRLSLRLPAPSGRRSWIGASALAARRRVSGGRDRLRGGAGLGAAGAQRLDRLGVLAPADRHAPRLGRLGNGIVSVSTPSWQLACTRSESSASPRKTCRA